VPVDGQRDAYATGSGTVLTADGYILTNFHVMGDPKTGRLNNQKGLAFIAVNTADLKSLPTWMYQAQIVKGDPKIDLAVLKVTAAFKGGALPKSLGLTPVPIGDSDLLEIGDPIHAVGFPGIGGDSVTYTSGTVSGFLDDDGDRKLDWIKTDAEVNHGNSGGLAINDAGEMVGIPTAGMTDVEAAGKISLIRPVSRALPLIKSAVVSSGTSIDAPATPGPGTTTQARITRLVFSDSVDANNQPGKAATAFPTGATAVYAVFEYQGFANGQKFEAVWNLNGKRDVVTPVQWSAGESGTWWVSISNQKGLIEGTYDLVLSLDNAQLYKARMTVGGAAVPTNVTGRGFGAPTFAEGVTASNEPVRPHTRGEPFNAGIGQIYAFTPYQNMEDGLAWSTVWYVDGEEVLRKQSNWQWGANGTFWVSIANKNGLPNGQYKLELYIGSNLVNQNQTSIGDGGSLSFEGGVQVMGVILDADSQRPIKGALFLVLKPGVSAEDFLTNPQDADVFAGGETDSKGQFMLDNELERGQVYTVVAAARGYQPTYDNLEIAGDEESPLELEIELRKR
jgi:S1-C subfamily serine protease